MTSTDVYYEDGNAESLGNAVRRKKSTGRLTNHVPIRFTEAMISRVRELAEEDGLTISSWIRCVVEHEVERRRPRRLQSDVANTLEIDALPGSHTDDTQGTAKPLQLAI